MENAIKVFSNPKFGNVRVIVKDGEPLFCGKDVTISLGYKDSVNALKQHCRGVAIYHPIEDSLGRKQEARFISEGDLYRLIAHSQLPDAERFEPWVFDEVLPSIRKMKNDKERNEEMGNELSTAMSEQGILTIKGIRCYEKDGVVYLNTEDVAHGLGFTTVAASGNEVVRWNTVHGYLLALGVATSCNGGPYKSACPPYIPENIFYRLCMKGKNEAAEAFQAKVADEVIPQIRKTGAYLTDSAAEALFNDPETFAKLAVKWANERKARLAAEHTVARQQEKIEADAPKVLFADSVSSSQTEILVGELAKILKQNGMDIGQNRLFKQLREDGYLVSRKGTDYNMPTQKSMELGLMRIKETTVTHADGHVTISKTPKVLGKGQVYFVNKYARRHLH